MSVIRGVLLLALLAFAAQAQTLIAFTHAASTSTTPATSSPGVDTTGAKVIVAYFPVTFLFDGPSSVTDNKGNTYTQGTMFSGSGQSVNTTFFYCLNPAVGAGHTFTVVGGFQTFVEIAAFGGAGLTFALDKQNGVALDSGSTTTLQPGSATPTFSGELLVSGAYGNNAGNFSVNSGFTLIDRQSGASAIAWQVQAVAAAINPTWTTDFNTTSAAGIITFKTIVPANNIRPQGVFF